MTVFRRVAHRVFSTAPPGKADSSLLLLNPRFQFRYRVWPKVLLTGVVASASLHYYGMFDDITMKKQPKKVLVIPFNRITVCENTTSGAAFKEMLDESEIEMNLKDIVDAIHAAATDPDIAAIYADFSSGIKANWADLEEIRNALKVFRESHRIHSEPNVSYQTPNVVEIKKPKALYAYAGSFGYRDYYLASICTHICLREKGDLTLFGLSSGNMFIRDFLQKYGIKIHVFKHGEYKNFANMFTESKFTRAHRENVSRIIYGIHDNVFAEITEARLPLLQELGYSVGKEDQQLWDRVKRIGVFTANEARVAGLVDWCLLQAPLLALLNTTAEANNPEGDKSDLLSTYSLTLNRYAAKVQRGKEVKRRRDQLKNMFRSIYRSPNPTLKEKIALLYIDGLITTELAENTVENIRQLHNKDEMKCVVMRINSSGGDPSACETIVEELKALDKPVVVSMGNTAASGGYYLAAAADRIFASSKTVTGSIGVFGIRPDFTGLAASYGIKYDSVDISDLSGTYDPFRPMTKRMKSTIEKLIGRVYDQFKVIVSEGRHISLDEVESIAAGRVWTGDQAREINLVDEIGGLNRAIAYAQRTFTNQTDVDVEVVRKPSLIDLLIGKKGKGIPFSNNVSLKNNDLVRNMMHAVSEMSVSKLSNNQPNIYLLIDENAALLHMLGPCPDHEGWPNFLWD